jgi:UDP-glucuronate decarboxylase
VIFKLSSASPKQWEKAKQRLQRASAEWLPTARRRAEAAPAAHRAATMDILANEIATMLHKEYAATIGTVKVSLTSANHWGPDLSLLSQRIKGLRHRKYHQLAQDVRGCRSGEEMPRDLAPQLKSLKTFLRTKIRRNSRKYHKQQATKAASTNGTSHLWRTVNQHKPAQQTTLGDECTYKGTHFTGSKVNLEHLLPNPRLELMRHDVTFPLYVETNQIYNLACPASPVHYQYDPVQTTKTSVHGAINMLGLAKRTRARILQASTSEVYGDPEVHPQPESYWGKVNPIGIRSCYDEGKRCAETLFFDYNRQHNLDIKVVRIFNTYGPRMHPNDGRVVSNFIVQALQGKDITIYGDGQQTRSFCYVDDLIDAMVKMMNSEKGFTGPVNIGNPGEFTMLQLAEAILKLSGSKSKIVHQPLPSDDPKQRQPNIELAKAKLAWQPKVNLEDGLKETIAYFKKVVA